MIDPRVRRPADKEELITRLAGDADSAVFDSMRDLFVFAAALGKTEERRVPLSSRSGKDPIRLDLFRSDSGHEFLIQTLAILAFPGDAEVLHEDRVGDRIAVFEEYVNGGLEIIQENLDAGRLLGDDDVLMAIVGRYIDKRDPDAKIDLSQFADDLGL
ncbi:DNA phosphorothioation-associated protein 4 [Dactylosporangium cerinum]|uniref:DNA phosphorothioation-associated protein 4 n=1 Tax=Dactylosporangium cerinum TaxID=1434730 RepID=A0ABV9VRV9_9ACTN